MGAMSDSQTLVETLHRTDPQFRGLCETIFGKALDAEEIWEGLYTPDGISKMSPGPSDVHVAGGVGGRRRGRLVPVDRRREPPAEERAVRKSRGRLVPTEQIADLADFDEAGRYLEELDDDVEKGESVDVLWSGEFAKADEDKRQVFGWASVVQLNGEPVMDRQGDLITPDEIEKAAYSYVHKSRVGGAQHRREGDTPFHASDMIESIVFTPEKIEKMGLPDDFPVGWWVGYQVHDDDTWSKIKKGEMTGFSIHGRGRREPVDA